MIIRNLEDLEKAVKADPKLLDSNIILYNTTNFTLGLDAKVIITPYSAEHRVDGQNIDPISIRGFINKYASLLQVQEWFQSGSVYFQHDTSNSIVSDETATGKPGRPPKAAA